MLFDSDINVYEENHVALSDAAEFNVRGKKTKIFSQKELDDMASKRQQILKKQELLRAERAKLTMMEKAPKTMEAKGPSQGARIEQNELIYIANKD